MTVQDAHKEYNSGEYGAVGTPAFNAEACELANLLACVSQLCQKWPATSNYTGPHSSNTEDAFQIKITLGRQFVQGMEDAALFP